MKKYNVYGMSCAACSASVERAVNAVQGVDNCAVSLLTNTMTVHGNATDENIILAVQKAGYDAEAQGKAAVNIPKPKKNNIAVRLTVSIVTLLVLMYFSMGHTMWGFPLPRALESNHLAVGLLQLILCSVIMVVNQRFFVNGFKGVIHGAPNMDTLVSLGSASAYIYSLAILFKMTTVQAISNQSLSMQYLHGLYFESAGMILTLVTVGKLLEERSKGKTTDAVNALMDLAPKFIKVIRDGKEVKIPAENALVGDIFIVRPGEAVPADGIVTEGASAVDESMLTGESVPVDKNIGDSVSSGTINKSGAIKCRVTKIGEDTVISKIIKTVSDAAASKPPIARIADRVSAVFVPVVTAIALITVIAWSIAGRDFGFALARGISVLVISCPCALGLATPVAVMVGSGVGAKNGILFKTAAAIENTGKAKTVVFDKTGTLTTGKPIVTDVIPCGKYTIDELLSIAGSLENNSNHPLALSVSEYAKSQNANALQISDFREISGSGVFGVCVGRKIYGVNLKSACEFADVKPETYQKVNMLSEEGKTPLIFISDNEIIGIIAVSDSLKEDAVYTVSRLNKMGIDTVMLTGDNAVTANAMAEKLNIKKVISGVLPEGKAKAIEELKVNGRVIMVGDGINDAPALTVADIGIAVGTGTDIAIDAADVVVMKSKLSDVVNTLTLSKATIRNIITNLFWAFIYNAVGIPIAAGLFIPLSGIELDPMFAAAAMSLSSVCVVLNALSLNLFKAKACEASAVNFNEKTEVIIMKKTLKINGMMCAHCEAHVRTALEAVKGVTVVSVSSKTNSAELTVDENTTDDMLKNAVVGAGYELVSIE